MDENQIVQVRSQFVDALVNPEIDELAALWNEIRRRGDSIAISEWFHAYPDDPDRRAVFILFLLFKELENRGIRPFSSNEVRLYPDARPLNWSKLPDPLRFLLRPAEQYGGIFGDVEVEEFLDQLAYTEKEELRRVAFELDEVWELLDAWIDKFPMVDNRESAKVYNVVLIISAARERGLF